MPHVSYMHAIQSDSQLLVVGNQIDTLTDDPSFGHNLCCRYSNRSCMPILNIYILRSFQWYKEVFYPISFDPLCRTPTLAKCGGEA
jgi:hypothetical protein